MKKTMHKQIGSMMYELVYFKGDEKYVVNGVERELMLQGAIHIPEIAVFDNEESAMVFWKSLDATK